MRKETIEVLKQLQAPFAQAGFEYILVAVDLVSNNRDFFRKDIVGLYEKVAELKQTTGTRVERSIRHTKEAIFKNANDDLLIEIFGTNKNMKSGDFLYALSYEMKGE